MNIAFKAITLAAVAALVSALAIACGDSPDSDTDPGLSRADVEGIVRSEMANESRLTREEVAEIAQATVAMAAADSLTSADVDAIVREAMAGMAAMSPGDGGLTRADVEAIVQAAVADIPPPIPSAPGLTAADVERIVRSAIADIPQPEPGLTREQVEEIARAAVPVMPPPIPPEPSLSRAEVEQIAQRVAASIPPRSEQAEYTKFFVDNAIAIYEADGLEDTLAYYNTPESVEGQWYVFIIDEDGYTISHYNPEIRGRDPSLRVDATGYFYGDDLLSATEEGKWVSYVFKNPATGGLDSKHTWAVRQDGLIFASGWYERSQN